MADLWETQAVERGWRKIATGTWYYDKTVPRPIVVWAKPTFDAWDCYDEDEELDESRPIPETNDGFVYFTRPGARETFLSVEEAKASADAQPWGPVKWD
jgi:hypothetical protein